MEGSLEVVRMLVAHFGTNAYQNNATIIIVPGGGIFADAVRQACDRFCISDDAAHWMAILAMEQYAYYIRDRTSVHVSASLDDIPSGVTLLLPYAFLMERDELPHSWDVTSDTIAAWIAKYLGLSSFVKVTDVDGIYVDGCVQGSMVCDEVPGLGKTCLDNAIPFFLKDNHIDCLIVNGLYPERVLAAVLGNEVTGTYIKGNI